MNDTTIAGISTALSNGGISVIRLSGPEAITIADKVYAGKKSLAQAESHTVHYGHIKENGEIVDEVLIIVMKAPRTYTKEDVVEIDCHGGIVVTRKILQLLLDCGAVLAEPGEFTKRAFLNGRMDLSQAESVMDLIEAKSEYELKASVRQLKGNLSKQIMLLRDEMMDDIAKIEAALDDPEHFDISDDLEEIRDRTFKQKQKLEHLLSNVNNGRIIKEGINTVILGKPNVGKSSLLNCLMEEERAIVTDIAGTTRDTLEETIHLQGMVLNMIDTAGIRETEDTIEKIGVEKSKNSAKNADLILYMVDASKEIDETDIENIKMVEDKPLILIRNKCDLGIVSDVNSLISLKEMIVIDMSIEESKGIDLLKGQIYHLFYEGKINFNEEIYINNLRHMEQIKNAKEALERVIESMDAGMPEDFFTIDMMQAYQSLGYVIGEEVEDDLVNRIFSKFCMGK